MYNEYPLIAHVFSFWQSLLVGHLFLVLILGRRFRLIPVACVNNRLT
jgi:hypothetical protein